MQSKNRVKCCKNTAVISRRVRLELTTFDFNGLEYCFILNRSLPTQEELENLKKQKRSQLEVQYSGNG